MEMSNLATKLRSLKLELSENILVHLVIIFFPVQLSQFKVTCNTQKDKWTLDEIISCCVEKEDRLKQERTESAHLASTSQDKAKKRKKDKGKEVAVGNSQFKVQKKQDTVTTCFF